jgi:ABC-type uncharacterized transport system ATPase subunit
VCVSFDGFKAINNLSLDIAPGELRCIIGPNGAGKTTMMDIITGKTRPDSGTVYFGSTIDLLRHNEPQIAQLGIGRKFQKPTVFEQLSVFENLELAMKVDKGVRATLFAKRTGAQFDAIALGAADLSEEGARHAFVGLHRQLEVLEDGVPLENGGLLELATDARMGDLRLGKARQVDGLAEECTSLVGARLARDDIHHRRLAGTVRADDTAQFASVDGQ